MKRIVLGIQYDGAPWNGWQTQPHGNTVQDQLQAALRQFSQTDILTTCAGRTDRGVHALEQVVHFDTELERQPFSWVRGVNAFLPPSVAVRWACALEPGAEGGEGGDGFHSRFSATARSYDYILYNNPIHSPLLRGKVGWVFRPLDVERMRQAALPLLGWHDFTSFRAAHCQAKSPVKFMHGVEIRRQGDMIIFSLRCSAFLHHMVRNIVGSLVAVGNGYRPPEWLEQVLVARNRSLAAPTFMPDGLYLSKIDYDPKWGLPQEQGSMLPWL